MTRLLFAVFGIALFATGVAAQHVIGFDLFATRVVSFRPVYDTQYQRTPLTAHYLIDEYNGVSVCSRVLYHSDGRFAVQQMPDTFCEPIR